MNDLWKDLLKACLIILIFAAVVALVGVFGP